MLRVAAARAVARTLAPASVRAARPRARDARRAPSRRAAASFAAHDDVRAIKLAPYCELLTRSNDAERPLAICVGWFGASLKHVKKYAAMYVDANCDAVAIAPPSAAMLVPAAVDAYADVILRALARHVRGKCVVHVASNGGFIFAGNLMLKAANGDATARTIFERTKGVVFDCAPGNLRPDIVARAFAAVVGGASATSEPSPYFEVFASWLLGRRVLSERLLRIDELWGKAGAPESILLRCPSMFMYSEADVLISPREIEAFATLRQDQTGHRSTLHKYDDAGHCEIGRDDYEDYKSKVTDFLERVVHSAA